MLTLTISKDALGSTAGAVIGSTQYLTLALSDAQGWLGPAWNTGLGSVGTVSGSIGLASGLVGTGLGLAGALSRSGGRLARHPAFTAGALTYGLTNLLGVAITSLIPTATVKVPQALAARAAMLAKGGGNQPRGGATQLPPPRAGTAPGTPLTQNQQTASYFVR